MAKTRNTPTHDIFILPDGDAGGSWTNAGAGWQNRDGSITFRLNTVVAQGARLQLRRRRRSIEAEAAARAAVVEAELAARRGTGAASTKAAEPRVEAPEPPSEAAFAYHYELRGGGIHLL